MSEILIVCGGNPSLPLYMKEKLCSSSGEEFACIIAVDSGADLLLTFGKLPDLLVGDLDSISAEALRWVTDHNVKQITFPSEKSTSDLELALDEVKKIITASVVKNQKTKCTLIGALGERVDHELFNLQVLTQESYDDIDLEVCDDRQSLYLVRPNQKFSLQGKQGDIFSLIPFTPEFFIEYLNGAKWNLKDEQIYFGSSRTVSNEFAGDEITMKISSGKCFLAHVLGDD